MTDEEKLKRLKEQHIIKDNIISDENSFIKIDKIQLSNFRFFTDDEENNSFELNGQNMLLYGENGSGKSSIFKAFELLAKIGKESVKAEFEKSKNIFNNEEEDSFSFIDFKFTNDTYLQINDDNHQKNSVDFIKNFSIFKPMLDYKELLKVVNLKDKNLYSFFELILSEYPIEKSSLKELRGQHYFDTLKSIIVDELLDNINLFLEEFAQNFKIESIDFDAFDRKIVLNIEYFEKQIKEDYQYFLNEARLSALAISIYFAIIKKQFTLLKGNSLKILVLDDLLISLDMSNRLNLLEILKTEFSNFQIFFFTHDKGFFEILKDKMSWKAYEIYVANDGEFEKPYIKKSLNYFESAIKHFNEYDYPACANYLRKEIERLKNIKEKQEQSLYRENEIFKKIKKTLLQIDLTDESKSGEIRGKLIGFKKGLERDSSVEIDLKNIRSITDRILNPQSHDDTSKPLYKKELQEAIEIIQELRETLQ